MNIEAATREYETKMKYFGFDQYKYPLRMILRKRAFHAFCVGTPKSGTHSIANLFEEFRTLHEPDEIFFINLIDKARSGAISHGRLKKILRFRDRSNWLEMESSHYSGSFVEELHSMFKDAKFILTIRDCLSWVDSWFNHQLSRPNLAADSIYYRGRANYYSRGLSYTKHDKFLENLGLYPLRSYLTFWRDHNFKVLDTVPDNRLLILKTSEISNSTGKLAKFLNVADTQLNSSGSHEFKAKDKYDILNKMDSSFLFDTAMELCGDINDKYFPEKSIEDISRKFTATSSRLAPN